MYIDCSSERLGETRGRSATSASIGRHGTEALEHRVEIVHGVAELVDGQRPERPGRAAPFSTAPSSRNQRTLSPEVRKYSSLRVALGGVVSKTVNPPSMVGVGATRAGR